MLENNSIDRTKNVCHGLFENEKILVLMKKFHVESFVCGAPHELQYSRMSQP